MLVIGITGTIGAGKGTAVEYLVEKYGFKHYSVRKYLSAILTEQGIPLNRDNFTQLANSLREAHQSPSYIIEALYAQAKQESNKAIIESIRTVGEIDKLKALGSFYLLAIDADPMVRYQRIIGRKSETDAISFEKFQADEAREMSSTNPNNQNLKACIDKADFVIQNNSDVNMLHQQIDTISKELIYS